MACVLVASLLEVVSQMGLVACAPAGASLPWVVSQIGLVACVRNREAASLLGEAYEFY